MLLLLNKLLQALFTRDFPTILAAVKELAKLVGFSEELRELKELYASIEERDWAGVVRNLGEFLLLIADRLQPNFSTSEACLEAPVEPQNLPVILAIIRLILLLRGMRS